MKRRFHKMHGLGNDFVIVDARDEPFEVTPALAKAIADRRTGVGCDQLIVLEPSDTADLKMRIWNSDGGEVESCGNATRCVVQLTGARTIDSDGGLLEGENLGAEVEVSIGEPRFGWDEIPLAYPMDTAALPMAWDELEHPMALNVGNPHLVFFVPDARDGAAGRSSARGSRTIPPSPSGSTSTSQPTSTTASNCGHSSAAPARRSPAAPAPARPRSPRSSRSAPNRR